MKRWYKAVAPLLKHYYGTGGDLNVDEIHEVIPMTEDCGIWHPQEGVFNGHFQPTEPQKINRYRSVKKGRFKRNRRHQLLLLMLTENMLLLLT